MIFIKFLKKSFMLIYMKINQFCKYKEQKTSLFCLQRAEALFWKWQESYVKNQHNGGRKINREGRKNLDINIYNIGGGAVEEQWGVLRI